MTRSLHSRFWLATLLVVACYHPLKLATAADQFPAPVLEAEQQRIAAIAKASKTAVSVFARGGRGGGSGVVITPDGYGLTNFHVSKPAGDHMKCSMADGELYDAVIVGIDPTGDVALIKLLGRDDFPHAQLADSDEVRVGDWCFAVGNPFLLATNFQPTVTYGIVSGVHRYQGPAGTLLEYADCIQTDASINPGNSGGPLFNAQGDLIGINGRGSFEKRGRVNVGVGYAISINQIKNFMGYLHSGRIVDHATLGATAATDDDGRVIVSNILESSDAYRRGLRYGDELIAFGGRPVSSVNQFKNVLGIFPKGWRIPLSYRREGERRDTYVRLAGVHAREELLAKIQRQPKQPPGTPKPKKDDPENPQPEPKGPKPKDAGPKDKKQPKLPIPLPTGPHAAKKPIPPHVAKLIKARSGYANYYFNELNRDRIWNAFSATSDFARREGPWVIRGDVAGGGAFELLLNDNEVSGQFPAGPTSIDPSADLDEQLAPEGSGGLLVALHVWRRLLRLGPKKFGEVYYLGTMPMLGREGLYDVLVGTYNIVETRFMFDPQTGHLVALEMFPDTGVDPCEIYFDDYQDVDGCLLPHRLEVRYGDRVFAEFQWKEFEFPEAPKEEA